MGDFSDDEGRREYTMRGSQLLVFIRFLRRRIGEEPGPCSHRPREGIDATASLRASGRFVAGSG